ncbi:MAG: hypothetical protein ACRDGR_01880 [bacterium]
MRLVVAGLVTALVALPSVGGAQDSHYWTDQFGTRANLLGGAVIGSKLDMSNTYYNPGALALVNDPSLLLGTGAYEYSRIGVKDAGAHGEDVSTSTARGVPSLFAVSFLSDWREGHSFAFSILTRRNFHLELDTGVIGTGEAIGGSPGAEDVAGGALLTQDVSDTWVGVTWSHARSPHLGFGLTQYVAVRSQSTRAEVILQAAGTTGEGGASVSIRDLSYWNGRILWKGGLMLDLSPLTLGLTVTTPSIDLAGSGQITSNDALLLSTGSSLAADYQEGVRAHDRSPLSIGIGGSYPIGRGAVHVSAEWFDQVPDFRVLDTAPWTDQTTGATQEHQVRNRLQEVFNVGIGLEYSVRDNTKLYAGFITDKSAGEEKKREDVTISTWDLYHASGGAEIELSFVTVTFGAAYAFGSSDVVIGDLDSSTVEGATGPTRLYDATYSRLKALFGLTFPFGD